MTVPCYYPTGEGEPPEGFHEWRGPEGLCEHDWCQQAADTRQMVRWINDIEEAIRSDRELVADEYGGMFR